MKKKDPRDASAMVGEVLLIHSTTKQQQNYKLHLSDDECSIKTRIGKPST